MALCTTTWLVFNPRETAMINKDEAAGKMEKGKGVVKEKVGAAFQQSGTNGEKTRSRVWIN